jgi:putative Mn2+ efflux pump MntP
VIEVVPDHVPPWFMLSILSMAAFVLPLGLDTFALATALGVAGLPERERLRVSLILTSFEATMPVIGFLIGSGVGVAVGKASDYVAAAVLAAVGIYLLWPWRDEETEEEQVLLLQRVRGLAIVGLGLGISLDELAIGFGVGLLRLPLAVLAVLIGAQAFVAAQLGMRLGSRLGEEVREWAERLAGLLLIAAGALVLLERVVS